MCDTLGWCISEMGWYVYTSFSCCEIHGGYNTKIFCERVASGNYSVYSGWWICKARESCNNSLWVYYYEQYVSYNVILP